MGERMSDRSSSHRPLGIVDRRSLGKRERTDRKRIERKKRLGDIRGFNIEKRAWESHHIWRNLNKWSR